MSKHYLGVCIIHKNGKFYAQAVYQRGDKREFEIISKHKTMTEAEAACDEFAAMQAEKLFHTRKRLYAKPSVKTHLTSCN
ncbi:hypothetical protein [Wielerella bovis]|uniref:hypothetical protein n=1 Tax=Wielerella bovis TaxID=2917790 RepID=UPI00201895EE|nr:hypothetical protein [Wielerella bovis]ULJ64022.1 hypothetical protein MIS33_07580 [Wielerella bovis]ULJ66634.1 hypothetical protein MIS31_10355 [Wielerella bovis]ULJ67517.1 hypothetical protein MIS31_02875 [Wielerella bovis]